MGQIYNPSGGTGGGGGGSVTNFSFTNANGVSGVVTNPSTIPNLTLSLGAITPTSVNNIVFSGSSTPNLTVVGTAAISGTNTGDQTSVSGNAGSASTIAVVDDTTTNATMDLLWVTTNTGNLPAKVSSTKLNFNPSTATLNTTVFSGTSLLLSQTASPTYLRGQLVYDTGNESLTFYNISSAVSWQIGRENLKRCFNNTGSTIANGAAVYISGFDATSGLQTIALALASSATTMVDVAVTTESITTGSSGEVTTLGTVNGLNTSTLTAGAPVYVSAATAGVITATAPTGTNIVYQIGSVGRVNATTGNITVSPNNAGVVTSGGGGTPGGSTTQLQYNNAGSFGGATWAYNNSTGGLIGTSASSSAFVVGPNGTTNPAFQIDASTASMVGGLKFTGSAAFGTAVLTTTSTDGFANWKITSGGTNGFTVLDAPSAGYSGIANAGFNQVQALGAQTSFSMPSGNTATAAKWLITSSACTALTASTESQGIVFNLASTQTHAAGSYALQRDYRIIPAIHAASGATIITDAATFSPAGPSGGTNVTLTNSHAIYIPSVALANATNSYGLTINASSGATNNYAAQFLGGPVKFGSTSQPTLIDGDMVNSSGQKQIVYNAGGNTLYSRSAIFLQTADGSVTGTSATSSFGTGLGVKTFAANTLTVGKTVTVLIGGTLATVTVPGNLTVAVKIGSVTISTATITNVQGSLTTGTGAFQLNMMVTVRTTGATGTVVCNGNVNYTTALLTRGFAALNNAGATSTIDTTSSQLIDVIWTWATTGNTLTQTTGSIEASA